MKTEMMQLPAGTELEYLAEGAANIIYKIVVAPSSLTSSAAAELDSYSTNTPPPTDLDFESSLVDPLFQGKLLRLRKNIPSGVPYKKTADNFNTKIKKLFTADELIDLTLIQLPPGLIERCNHDLRRQHRPAKREGVFLATDEQYGLLITDMTTHVEGEELIEFKPKWLLPSPSAPKEAVRCRTCAFRDLRNLEARSQSLKEDISFCPLDLISTNIQDVAEATGYMKAKRQDQLVRYLHMNPLLQRIRAHQTRYNAVGLNHQDPDSIEVSLSMTIRDCTMFIKMPANKEALIEARLGDLDLKTGAGGKAQYWEETENRLIKDGWYANKAKGQITHGLCHLQRRKSAVR